MSLINTRLSPSIGKIYLMSQNAFVVKKQIRSSHIRSSNMPNEAFSQLISRQSPFKKQYFKSQKQPFTDNYKIGTLKDFAIFNGKKLCWSLFLRKLQLYQKETPTQVFSCKYCKIFKVSFIIYIIALYTSDVFLIDLEFIFVCCIKFIKKQFQ